MITLRVPPLAQDALLAVAVTVFVVVTEVSERRHHEHVPTTGVLLLCCLAPALTIRRRFPGTALAMVAAIQLGLYATGTAAGANVPAELIAPYSVAVWASARVRLACLAVAAAALIAVALPWWPNESVRGGVLGFLLGGAGAWLLGAIIRSRREGVSRLAERADQLTVERDRRAREAVAEERLRIARELHDVVAHNLSVVIVQSQALQPMVTGDGRELAVSIEDTGREALEEMRHLLGVLRSGTEDEEGPVPQPGLDRLDALVEQVRQAGLPVELNRIGSVRKLPPAVELSAYRIVQEALTNVLKHAGPASVAVAIDYRADELSLRIEDDGRGAAARLGADSLPSFGHGLVGMRERLALFGGSLSAGPRAGGGFRVHANIPLEAS